MHAAACHVHNYKGVGENDNPHIEMFAVGDLKFPVLHRRKFMYGDINFSPCNVGETKFSPCIVGETHILWGKF